MTQQNEPLAPLLLLGVSRSGTTLFQRILNSYHDVIIWGEHIGYLADLAESYFKVADSPSMKEFSFPQAKGKFVDLEEYKNPKQWQAWNNWFDQEDIKLLYREFLLETFAGNWKEQLSYWGFKEIRYGEDGDRVMDFFLDIFPDTKTVIIFRNPLNVIESQLSSFANIGGRLAKIRKILLLPKLFKMAVRWNRKNLKYLEYSRKYPDSVLFFQFEEILSDQEFLRGVLNWLGLELTETQLEVLRIKEGRGSAFERTKDSQGTNRRWKKLGMLPTGLIYLLTNRVYKKIVRETSDLDFRR